MLSRHLFPFPSTSGISSEGAALLLTSLPAASGQSRVKPDTPFHVRAFQNQANRPRREENRIKVLDLDYLTAVVGENKRSPNWLGDEPAPSRATSPAFLTVSANIISQAVVSISKLEYKHNYITRDWFGIQIPPPPAEACSHGKHDSLLHTPSFQSKQKNDCWVSHIVSFLNDLGDPDRCLTLINSTRLYHIS